MSLELHCALWTNIRQLDSDLVHTFRVYFFLLQLGGVTRWSHFRKSAKTKLTLQGMVCESFFVFFSCLDKDLYAVELKFKNPDVICDQ